MRSFYEDDEAVVTKPGINKEISKELKEKEDTHAVSFVLGMAIRTAPFLESFSNNARLWLHGKVSKWEAEFGNVTSAVKNEYNTLNHEVQSVIKEPVLPNLVYILTFTLTGSILVNRRGLTLRFLTPTIFGAVGVNYFMPQTTKETLNRISDYESKNYPQLYEQQKLLITEVQNTKQQAKQLKEESQKSLTSFVHDARVSITDYFKKSN